MRGSDEPNEGEIIKAQSNLSQSSRVLPNEEIDTSTLHQRGGRSTSWKKKCTFLLSALFLTFLTLLLLSLSITTIRSSHMKTVNQQKLYLWIRKSRNDKQNILYLLEELSGKIQLARETSETNAHKSKTCALLSKYREKLENRLKKMKGIGKIITERNFNEYFSNYTENLQIIIQKAKDEPNCLTIIQ